MIIGITGLIASGKSTATEYLVTRHNYQELAFANALKYACMEIFGLDKQQVFGTQTDKETIDTFWKVSPRQLLQIVGSAVRGLGTIFPQLTHIWVKRVERDIKKLIETDKKLIENDKKIIVSDVRYPDEAKMILDMGGIIIQIKRLDAENNRDLHESENQIISANYIIYNDTTKKYLYNELDKIILANLI